MRGRGNYIPRGGGTMRGGGGYYNNRNSSNYVNTRTQGNYRPNNGRYENNYHHNNRYSGGNNNNSNNDHYDNRNRDKFNNHHNSSTGGRYDSGSSHKRSYDSSRDRGDDRKRPRQDDYRRTSSSNDHNDRPSSSSQNMGSSSSSYHQRNSTGGGGGGSSSSYRPRDDSGSQRHQRDSSMGPPKRPLLRSVAGTSYISRPRGSMSIRGGMMRNNMRGVGTMRIVRPRLNESNDLRTMRRQLLYAQQKDRARLLKIQQLKSSLRRQRQAGNSSDNSSDDNDDSDKADKGDHSDKKKMKSNEDDGEDDEDNDDKDGADGEDKKNETTKKSTIKKRSNKTATEDAEGKSHDDKGKDDDDDQELDDNNGAEKKKAKVGTDDDDDAYEEAGKVKTDESGDNADKPKEKGKSSDTAEKSIGKKKDKDGDDKDSKSKKSSSKKDRSARKDKDESEDDRKERRTTSRHRDDEHNLRPRTFIKLTCVHCRIKCVTFKEYHYHLNSRTHKNSMRTVALRQRADLQRMRARQRTTQREIEENSKEEYESRYCRLCRLAYRQPKNLHQASEHHKTIKKFLMPYCGSCHLAFKNAMLYENHRCSLEHIRNKARNDESGSEDSVDEREIDLNKFLTVDSVGEIDDDIMDADVDAMLLQAETAQKSADEETRKRGLIGLEFIKAVEAFYCEICNHYSSKQGDDTLEAYTKKHCLQHLHVKNYLRHKEETEKKSKSDEGEDDDPDVDEEGNKLPKDTDEAEAEEDIEMEAKDEDEEEEDYEGEDGDGSHDEKLWEEVDKDLGDLLAEVKPLTHEEEDEEDESVLNIDIESEKNKLKDVKDESNGNADESAKDTKPAANTPDKKPAAPTNTPTKSATAVKAESTTANKAMAKVIKANRPGPASMKRQVLVSLKRTSAADIKAATKSATDSK